MFKSKLLLSALFALVLSVFSAQAQNARLQVIHNAADPAAASVDIYVNDSILLNDFGFREATEFIDVPANTVLNIGVAPGTSNSAADTLRNFVVTLAENETYIAVANGVLNPDNFAANPDGASTAFNLYVKAMAREMAMDSESVEFFVLHGSTDAPTVDVIARDVATLVDNAPYTAMTDYIAVPPATYLLDVTPGEDNNTIVATFEADLSGLAGGAAAVFASGFLNPSANQDGPAFGIFAALPNGAIVEFPVYMPGAAAPTPSTSEANVISLFSNAYTDVTVDTWSANWDVADLQDIQIEGNDTKLYTSLQYAGIEFTSQTIDATEMTNFRMDIWTPDPTETSDFKIKLVDFGADGGYQGGDDTEDELTFTAPFLKSGNWVTIDIPLADFEKMTERAHLAQLIISGSINTVYVDNVYLYAKPTARLQVIHNAADPGAASVDIYVNGGKLLDDFGYREATSFIDVDAEVELNIGVAPGTSTSVDDTLRNFPVTLANGGTYVVFANGVLDPNNFTDNPDGKDIAFTLLVKDMAREMAMDSESVEFFVLHGSTDAPTVDVIARDVATLVDNAPYTAMTDYIAVPPASYLLDVTPGEDNNTIVATFEADLSGLAGGAAAVFASGFLAPAEGQPAFGIYAALPDGNVVAFTPKTTARVQIIHNAADPGAASVDIYLNDGILLDNFGFREATAYIDAPANQMVTVSVAGPESGSVEDAIASFDVNFKAGGTYVVFANGVLDTTNFAANPDGASTAFNLYVKAMAREMAMDSESVEFFVLHGSTDAPTVDVIARDVATLVDNAPYTAMTDYIAVPPASYLLDVTPGEDNNTIVATFEADLSGLAGGAAAVFASGFLAPAEGQPAFGIYAALPDGNVVAFTPKTTARVQIIHNAADPGAASVDIYLNDGLLLDNFGFREATPYIDAPANQMVTVSVAGPASGSVEDAIASFDVNFKAGETYVVFANGVLDTTKFTANPDGKDIAFTLLIKEMAREMAMDSESVEFFVLHGSTDAPTVDVIARDVATLVDNAAYTDMTDYIAVPPASYLLDVTPGEDNETIVATFEADLSGLAGGAAAVFASGFLTPSANQDGPAFGIFAALPNGTVVSFGAITSINDEILNFRATSFELSQNYPNPFNPTTTISFSIPETQFVTIKVFNVVGQEIATLASREYIPGAYQLQFDASEFGSGIYFYTIQAGEFNQTRRMTLLK